MKYLTAVVMPAYANRLGRSN